MFMMTKNAADFGSGCDECFIPVPLLAVAAHQEHRTGLGTSGREQSIPSMSLAGVGFV